VTPLQPNASVRLSCDEREVVIMSDDDLVEFGFVRGYIDGALRWCAPDSQP
jgi:hypothetical protein